MTLRLGSVRISTERLGYVRTLKVLCRVEFSKIGKRDVTFIREMRVVIHKTQMC